MTDTTSIPVDTSSIVDPVIPVEETTTPEIPKYKVKVDGQELDVSIDDLIKGYSTQSSASKRITEAQKVSAQAKQIIELAKSDPKKFLSHPDIGVDVKEWAMQFLAEVMEDEMLDPKDRELKSAKQKLSEFEAEKKAAADAAQEEEIQKLVDHYQQDYYTKITGALETSGLPKSNSTVKRMAYYMNEGLKQKLDIPMADVVELVKQDYISEINSLFGVADEQTILNLLGEANVNKIAKGHVNKLSKVKPKVEQDDVPFNSGKLTTAPKISPSEFRKKFR